MMSDLNKKIFIFDLDGTLTESKSVLKKDMSNILCKLLENDRVIAVISGGNFKQFANQFLANLNCSKEHFSRLFLLPTSGSQLYLWNNKEDKWYQNYALLLKKTERKKIFEAFEKVFKEVSFKIPKPLAGVQIQDRETQVTFSALGQEAPIKEKKKWDSNHKKRLEIVEKLQKYIPEFEIRIGGTSSIDITKKGVDKEYGVNKFIEFINGNKKGSIFFGDALFSGGNDFPVTKVGIDTVQVSGPNDVIKNLKKYFN